MSHSQPLLVDTLTVGLSATVCSLMKYTSLCVHAAIRRIRSRSDRLHPTHNTFPGLRPCCCWADGSVPWQDIKRSSGYLFTQELPLWVYYWTLHVRPRISNRCAKWIVWACSGTCTDILGGRCSNQKKGHPMPKKKSERVEALAAIHWWRCPRPAFPLAASDH